MKNKKKTIFFSIEISARELESKCLLTLEMIKRGFRAYIGSTRILKQLNGQTNSCLFFHKSSWNSHKVANLVNRLGAQVVFLDEEMGPSLPESAIPSILAARHCDVRQNDYADIFVLGQRHKEVVEALPQFARTRVHAMGWPRLDLWRDEFQQRNLQKADALRKEFGSFFLLVSSFGAISNSSLSEFKIIREKKGLRNNDRADFKYQEFKDCLQLVDEISNQLKGEEKLIIRPHHSESMNCWKKHINGYRNVILQHEGDITPWLLASKGTIQFGSTVAIQAALMGVPSAQLNKEFLPGITDSPSYQLVKQSQTPEELLRSIRSSGNINPKALRERATECLKGLVSNLNGPMASEVIADYLATIDLIPQSPIQLTSFRRHFFLLKEKINYIKYLKKKQSATTTGSINRMRFEKIPNGLRKDDIESRLVELARARGYTKARIQCRQVATNLVEIEMK